MNAEAISQTISSSLELVGEKCADPTPLVYERLFRQSPEVKPLFVRDKEGLIKGEMLFQVIECLIDFAGSRAYSANLIPSELRNHENIGVPPEVFATFFRTVMETFRDIAGADWTAEMEQAWDELLGGLDRLVSRHAAEMKAVSA